MIIHNECHENGHGEVEEVHWGLYCPVLLDHGHLLTYKTNKQGSVNIKIVSLTHLTHLTQDLGSTMEDFCFLASNQRNKMLFSQICTNTVNMQTLLHNPAEAHTSSWPLVSLRVCVTHRSAALNRSKKGKSSDSDLTVFMTSHPTHCYM